MQTLYRILLTVTLVLFAIALSRASAQQPAAPDAKITPAESTIGPPPAPAVSDIDQIRILSLQRDMATLDSRFTALLNKLGPCQPDTLGLLQKEQREIQQQYQAKGGELDKVKADIEKRNAGYQLDLGTLKMVKKTPGG